MQSGLGWVVMRPEGHRPLIMHKSGGLRGEFSFLGHGAEQGYRRVRFDERVQCRRLRRHGQGNA